MKSLINTAAVVICITSMYSWLSHYRALMGELQQQQRSRLTAAEPAEHRQTYTAQDVAIIIKTGEATISRVKNMQETWLRGLHNVVVINSEDYGHRQEAIAYFRSDAYKIRLKQSALFSRASVRNPGYVFDTIVPTVAFQAAFSKFPRCKWFLLVDDDSFVFMRNLLKVLEDFRWTDEVFLGGEIVKNKQILVDEGRGLNYAPGGCGTILSAAAVKQLLAVFPDFAASLVHPEIPPGDVKFAAIMADAGMLQAAARPSETSSSVCRFMGAEPEELLRDRKGDPCSLSVAVVHKVKTRAAANGMYSLMEKC